MFTEVHNAEDCYKNNKPKQFRESTIIVFIDKFKNIISVVIELKKVLEFPCKFRKSTITVSNNL